jgi:hypothetical protein
MSRLALLILTAAPLIFAEDFGVRVILGLGDTSPTKWDGSAAVSGASIRGVEPWRFEGPDAISGNSWKVSTRAIRLFGGANRKGTPPIVANGVIVGLSGATGSSELQVKTAQGDFTVRMSDIPYGKPASALNGRVMLDRIPAASRITDSPDEQDFPAAAARNGEIWIAYLEFKHNPDHDRLRTNFQEAPANFNDRTAPTGGDTIFARHYANGKWDAAVAVTPGGEDLYRPAAAIDGKGRAWIFWSKNEKGNFDLFGRMIENGKAGATVRLSTAPGSDIDPAAATDSQGNVWVAWQGWRNGRGQIFAAKQNGNAFAAATLVASSQSNEWNPAIAADSNGRVTVAWDSYRNGNYDVFYRTVASNTAAWGKEMTGAATAKFESRPSIAYSPDGRLWMAYEEGTERWGKDWGAEETSGYALYSGRAIRLRGFDAEGRVVETATPVDGVLPGQPAPRVDAKNRQADLTDWTQTRPTAWKERKASATPVAPVSPKNSAPRLTIDASGRLWLAARSPHPTTWITIGTVWSEYVASYDGTQWTGPVFVGNSDNLLDNRPALVSLKGGDLTVIGSSDHRRNFQLQGPARPRQPGVVSDPYNNDLYMNHLSLPAGGGTMVKASATTVAAGLNPEDKAEQAAIAKMHAARVAGKYRVVRGEFHRHSEVSADGGNDGTLLDQWRYALDAGRMDWIGCCDHDNGGGREYTWWLTQKLTDVFYTPGAFVPMFSYERSVVYPEGHRNVVFAQRGVRTLPRLPLSDADNPKKAPDTQMLYAYLRKFNGIVASHTSGTNMGTDWRDNDPAVETVVEIYQGDRQNYEMPGAPRSNSESDSIGGWRPKGFVSLALEMGYKLAFEASSDHISTHMSYCNILSTGLDRDSLLAGFRARHVYGATDNILAEFHSGSNIMGDAFSSAVAPNLSVKLNGTAPFAKVHIIKDNKYVYTTSPGKADVEFQWRDSSPTPGKTSYYYVRGEQTNGELVWASPMWITYTGK